MTATVELVDVGDLIWPRPLTRARCHFRLWPAPRLIIGRGRRRGLVAIELAGSRAFTDDPARAIALGSPAAQRAWSRLPRTDLRCDGSEATCAVDGDAGPVIREALLALVSGRVAAYVAGRRAAGRARDRRRGHA